MPAAAQRSSVSLRLRPASMSRRVFDDAISVQLPALEDARTETWRMAVLLFVYFIPSRLKHF
jgi:hypothetical protein